MRADDKVTSPRSLYKARAMTDQPPANTVSYRRVFALAWPASVAAAVTPLLGAVDVWALANSSQPLGIAAVALASIIFSLAYWSFGFIRMSVAGLTAQAVGAGDEREARAALIRGSVIGGGIGIILVVLQIPIGIASFHLLALDSDASAQTFTAAREYYDIRIWGAPFAIASYAAFGWFTARERTDFLMIASIIITLINIILDYIFVVHWNWGASGVAAGTLIAEIAGFFVCLGLVILLLMRTGGLKTHWRDAEYLNPQKLKRTVSVNFDIFVRTGLLSFSFAWFTQRSGAFGDVTLAANQVLMQLMLFTGLALDGTAIAAETLVGQSLGAGGKSGLARYRIAVRRTFEMALVTALLFAIAYAVAGGAIINLLTPEGILRAESMRYLPWVIASPLIVVVCFQLDGVFIGATRAREMRDSMIISTAVFIPVSIVLADSFNNHGLWAAFSLYFILRALTLALPFRKIERAFDS